MSQENEKRPGGIGEKGSGDLKPGQEQVEGAPHGGPPTNQPTSGPGVRTPITKTPDD